MTSAIANDGMLMRPQIVDRIVDGDDRVVKVFDPEVVANEVASKAGLEVGREGMRVGVEKGIIFPLRNNPFEWQLKLAQLSLVIGKCPTLTGRIAG